MKSFELVYTIEKDTSWRHNKILIKSNLADDELVDCRLAQSLVNHLKKESAILKVDQFLLNIAEAQKRGIQTSLEDLDDMALQAKIHADKVHEILSSIAEESEEKYFELEKKFSETEKRFNERMKTTAENIKEDLAKMSEVEKKLTSINNYSLSNLIEALNKIVSLAEKDPELVKLVLNHKNS